MTSNNQLPLSDMEQAAVIQELHNAFNQTTSEIAKLVNKSVPTVEKLLLLSTANHDVQKEVKSGAVSVDVAVDRVKEFGEKAGEVLQKDKASAAAKGKKKVTRSVIAPEISVKKARRLVELISGGYKRHRCYLSRRIAPCRSSGNYRRVQSYRRSASWSNIMITEK